VAVKKPFLRKGNREKRLSYARWHKKWTENQWLMEGWILPRARTSTLLKQCGIILTENGTKDIQRTALECPSGSLENYSWRLLKEMTESKSKRVQAVLENKGAHNKYWLSVIIVQTLILPHTFMFARVWINYWTYLFFLLATYKEKMYFCTFDCTVESHVAQQATLLMRLSFLNIYKTL